MRDQRQVVKHFLKITVSPSLLLTCDPTHCSCWTQLCIFSCVPSAIILQHFSLPLSRFPILRTDHHGHILVTEHQPCCSLLIRLFHIFTFACLSPAAPQLHVPAAGPQLQSPISFPLPISLFHFKLEAEFPWCFRECVGSCLQRTKWLNAILWVSWCVPHIQGTWMSFLTPFWRVPSGQKPTRKHSWQNSRFTVPWR